VRERVLLGVCVFLAVRIVGVLSRVGGIPVDLLADSRHMRCCPKKMTNKPLNVKPRSAANLRITKRGSWKRVGMWIGRRVSKGDERARAV